MEFQDFVGMVARPHERTFKVNGSYGVYDAYKAIRKKNWLDIGRPLKEHEFYTIIRSVNNYLADEIADGNTVVFPSKMGKLELRKNKRGASFVDGKLKVTYPINWNNTLRLWYEDKEAMKNKTLIRDPEPYVFKVRYIKHDANYTNKAFYEFCLNRNIKHKLKDNIKSGKVDTLYIEG